MKSRYDLRHLSTSYAVGNHVWLWTPVHKGELCQKFLASYTGPFAISRKLSDVDNVVAKLTSASHSSDKTHVVHVTRSERCHGKGA